MKSGHQLCLEYLTEMDVYDRKYAQTTSASDIFINIEAQWTSPERRSKTTKPPTNKIGFSEKQYGFRQLYLYYTYCTVCLRYFTPHFHIFPVYFGNKKYEVCVQQTLCSNELYFFQFHETYTFVFTRKNCFLMFFHAYAFKSSSYLPCILHRYYLLPTILLEQIQ